MQNQPQIPQTPATNATPTNQSRQPAATNAVSVPLGPAPLQKVRSHPRSQSDPESVSITFLSGKYAGESLSVGRWLGSIVKEVAHDLSAEWKESEGLGIRCSANFEKLGARTFSLSVEFYDSELDISHLAENLSTLLEIDSAAGTPPLLLLRQGALVAKPIFCTRITPKYSYPHGGDRGYKLATVDLSFQLMGGLSSEHATGKPLVATPLVDAASSKTQEQQRREAVQSQVETLLAPCLGKEGSDQLKALLTDNKMQDVDAIAKLSSGTFVQSAIGGLIPSKALDDPRLRRKLEADLAIEIARKEDGIGNSANRFAEALITGNVAPLAPDLQSQAVRAREDYQVILSAIASQSLGNDAQVFSLPSAAGRMRKLGSCGLSFRQVGAIAARGTNGNDDAALKAINDFLSDPKTNKQVVKQRFGLKTESQADLLIKSRPYRSKDEFLQSAARLKDGIVAQAAWNRFQQSGAISQ